MASVFEKQDITVELSDGMSEGAWEALRREASLNNWRHGAHQARRCCLKHRGSHAHDEEGTAAAQERRSSGRNGCLTPVARSVRASRMELFNSFTFSSEFMESIVLTTPRFGRAKQPRTPGSKP